MRIESNWTYSLTQLIAAITQALDGDVDIRLGREWATSDAWLEAIELDQPAAEQAIREMRHLLGVPQTLRVVIDVGIVDDALVDESEVHYVRGLIYDVTLVWMEGERLKVVKIVSMEGEKLIDEDLVETGRSSTLTPAFLADPRHEDFLNDL